MRAPLHRVAKGLVVESNVSEKPQQIFPVGTELCLTDLLFLQISYRAQLCAELLYVTIFRFPALPSHCQPQGFEAGVLSNSLHFQRDFSEQFSFPTLVAFIVVKNHPGHWIPAP